MQDNKELQKKYYNKTYQKEHVWDDSSLSKSTKYFTERFIEIAINSETKKILEIGCGNGLLTFFLLKRPVIITAVDISDKAIENLKNQFSEEISQRKLNLECADMIEFLENSAEKFDAIVGSGIIHHIAKNDWDRLFRLVYEKLNPGGVFACAPEPNAGGIYQITWRWAKFFYKIFGIEYDWEVERETLGMLPKKLMASLQKAGFSKTEILPFQTIPHFHLSILAYFDKLILDRIDGRLAMYIIIKGEKPLNASQTIMQ